jgi:hypothetical protein
MFWGLLPVFRNTAIGGIATLLAYFLSLVIFKPMSSSSYWLMTGTAFVTALLSFLACSMVIAFFHNGRVRRRGADRLRQLQMEERAKLALYGMIVAQFLFWLFLPKIMCRSQLDNSYICLGGDETLSDVIGTSLAASLTGFVLGWTVFLWVFGIVVKLTIGTGDDFADFLIYNKELHKAVEEERSVPRD